MDAVAVGETKFALWRARPDVMVYDLWPAMAGKLDHWQVDGLQYAGSKRRNKRLCLTASAGVGKTAELAWLAINRMLCYARAGVPGGMPKGAAISRDGNNLHANFVPELTQWVRSSPLLSSQFEINSERMVCKRYPGEWFLEFRAWPKKANKEEQGRTLSGLHSLFPFVIMDESATIPFSVGQTAEQIETACEDSLIAQAGNPESSEGCLYRAAVMQRHNWYVIEITSDPDDPKRCQRVDIDLCRMRIKEAALGRDDPWVAIFILGRFPKTAVNQLLSVEDVRAAMDRNPKPDEYNWAPTILGVDVARQGLNWSVIYSRQHTMVWMPIRRRGLSGPQGAALVAHEWAARDASACFIDNTGGFGGSWIDHLRTLPGFSPIPVEYAGSDQDLRFKNKRAAIWWRMAEAIKAGCSLPKGAEELVGDLSTPLYTFVGDKLMLEDKESIAARLQRSPDDGDALANTWAFPVMAAPTSDPRVFFTERGRNRLNIYDDGDPRRPLDQH